MTKFFRLRFRLFVAWNVHRVAFRPILFSTYFCSVDRRVVCIVSGCCNQSFSMLFYVAILNTDKSSSSFFSWHIIYLYTLSQGLRPYTSSWVFLFSGLIVEIPLSFTLRMVPSILRGSNPGIYLSDKIFAT